MMEQNIAPILKSAHTIVVSIMNTIMKFGVKYTMNAEMNVTAVKMEKKAANVNLE